MSDPNSADLDDEWAEANAAAQELREGIDRLRRSVEAELRRLRNDDSDTTPT
jgi:hypothetical protein